MLGKASGLGVAGSYDRHRDQTAEVSSIVVEQKGTGASTAKSRWDNWADAATCAGNGGFDGSK